MARDTIPTDEPTSCITDMKLTFEHVHVMINHLPIHGLAIALLALAGAMVIRSRPAQLIALALTVFCSAMVMLVSYTGNQAFDAVIALTDDAGTEWLDEHSRRAGLAGWVYYAAATFGMAAIFFPLRWPRSTVPLAAVTLALGAAALLGGGWTARAGGQIRHPELREEAPAAVTSP